MCIRLSVTFDKICVHPIRVNVLLTLDRVNLDLLCPWWLPHRCHIAATLDGQGCWGRIWLAKGCIRWWRGAYAFGIHPSKDHSHSLAPYAPAFLVGDTGR
jgi:hypothetical protein